MRDRLQSSSIRTRRSSGRARAGHGTETWNIDRAADKLKGVAEKRNIEGQAQSGIRAKKVLGDSKPTLDELPRYDAKNHTLEVKLRITAIQDARILASQTAEKDRVADQ